MLTKRLVLVLSTLAFFVLLSSVSVVPAAAEQAEIEFVNETSYWVSFYIDGIPSGGCPPGDTQKALADVGRHTLKAVTATIPAKTATRVIDLKSNGMRWTVDNGNE